MGPNLLAIFLSLYIAPFGLAGADSDWQVVEKSIPKEISTNKAELVRALEKLSGPKWVKLTSYQKFAVLNNAEKTQFKVSAARLQSNLQDESHEVRIESVRLAGDIFLQTQDPAFLATIQQALHSSPYQVRLEALWRIQKLPPTQQHIFRDDLNSCRQDPNREVRELCLETGRI